MTSASDIRAGGAYVELYGKNDELKKSLDAATKDTKQWASDLTSMGAGFAGLGAAIVAPFALATKSFVDQGGILDDVAQRTGASVEALSELKYAAEMTGTSLDDLVGGFRKMSQVVDGASQGQQSSIDMLKQFGLSVDDLRGKSPEELFSIFGDRIAAIDDPIHRASMAMAIFGKSGSNLVPLLSMGSAGIAALREEANSLGLSMSGEDVAAAAEFGDSIDKAMAAVRGFSIAIGASLAPALKSGTDLFVALAKPTMQFIRDNSELITAVALGGAALLTFGVAATGLGIAMSFASTALAGFSALAGLVAAVATAPLTWIIAAGAAVVGVVAYVTGGFSAMKSLIGTVISGVTETIQGVANAIRKGDIETAWKIVGAALNIGWIQTVNALKDVWREFSLFVGDALMSPLKAVTSELAAFVTELQQLTGVDIGVATINGIDDQLNSATSGAREAANAAKEKDAAALSAAQMEFKTLVDSVKPAELPKPDLKNMPDIDGIGQSAAEIKASKDQMRESTVGTFSGRAASALAGSSSVNKIATATAQTAANTKKIADKGPQTYGA